MKSRTAALTWLGVLLIGASVLSGRYAQAQIMLPIPAADDTKNWSIIGSGAAQFLSASDASESDVSATAGFILERRKDKNRKTSLVLGINKGSDVSLLDNGRFQGAKFIFPESEGFGAVVGWSHRFLKNRDSLAEADGVRYFVELYYQRANGSEADDAAGIQSFSGNVGLQYWIGDITGANNRIQLSFAAHLFAISITKDSHQALRDAIGDPSAVKNYLGPGIRVGIQINDAFVCVAYKYVHAEAGYEHDGLTGSQIRISSGIVGTALPL